MSSSAELKQKEVINISDGRRIGFVSDIEIDIENGTIIGIVIPLGSKMFGFRGKEKEFIIPWEKIEKIGEDIIIVNLDERFLRRVME